MLKDIDPKRYAEVELVIGKERMARAVAAFKGEPMSESLPESEQELAIDLLVVNGKPTPAFKKEWSEVLTLNV